MRHILITFGGLGILAVALWLGRLTGAGRRHGAALGAEWFVPVWAIVTIADLVLGIVRDLVPVGHALAGFSLAFTAPVLTALIAKRWLLAPRGADRN